jgi:hypothetical protein
MISFISLSFKRFLKKNPLSYKSFITILILFLISRFSSVFILDSYLIYFLNYIFLLLFILVLLFMFFRAVNIFIGQDEYEIKEETLFFKTLNIGKFLNHFLKWELLFFYISILYLLFAIYIWDFTFRYYLSFITVSSLFFSFRMIGINLKFKNLYFILTPLFITSFYYSIYVIPNIIYIMNGRLYYVVLYCLLYIWFYFFISYISFCSLWSRR